MRWDDLLFNCFGLMMINCYFSVRLKKHVKAVHLKIKDWKCDVCNKSFSEKRKLKQHAMLHTGERKYQCTVCGVGFVYKSGEYHHPSSQLPLHSTTPTYCCIYSVRTNGPTLCPWLWLPYVPESVEKREACGFVMYTKVRLGLIEANTSALIGNGHWSRESWYLLLKSIIMTNGFWNPNIHLAIKHPQP